MKVVTVALSLLLLFTTVLAAPVRAQEDDDPPPEPVVTSTPGPLDEEFDTEEIKRAPADTMYMNIELVSFKIPRSAPGPVASYLNRLLGNLLASALKLVSTVEIKGQDMKVTTGTKYARKMQPAAVKTLQPFLVAENSRRAREQPIRQVSLTGIFCVYKSGEGLIGSAITDKMIHVQNNPEMALEMDEAGRLLAAYDSTNQLIPNDQGVLDMRREDYRTKKAAPLGCNEDFDTDTSKKVVLSSRERHELFAQLFGAVPVDVLGRIRRFLTGQDEAQGNEPGDYPDSLLCDWFGPCDTVGVIWKPSEAFPFAVNTCDNLTGEGCETNRKPAYPISEFEDGSSGLPKPGYWKTYAPEQLLVSTKNHGAADELETQPIVWNGTHDLDDPAAHTNAAVIGDYNNFGFCIGTPIYKQEGNDLLDNSVAAAPPPPGSPVTIEGESENGLCEFKAATPACGGWEDKLETNTGGDCGICGGNLGKLAKQILTTAGKTYGVPAANIWAAMKHEGADGYQGTTYDFNDDNVRKWSNTEECGGEPMPGCDNENPITQPPFGFLEKWFYLDGGGTGAADTLWSSVQKIDETRNSKEKVSRCNFLDAAFAAAHQLQVGAGMQLFPMCSQYHTGFTGTRPQPGQCDSGFWTDPKIAQSQIGYAGSCVEDDPEHLYTNTEAVQWFHDAACW
jgi:hypothetical protein